MATVGKAVAKFLGHIVRQDRTDKSQIYNWISAPFAMGVYNLFVDQYYIWLGKNF